MKRERGGCNQGAEEAGTGRLYPYMAKVASHSYIHGLKEVYASRTLKEKIFWILVCLICCAAASYEILQIIILYREKGMATKIHVHSVSAVTYPTLLICPTRWLSKRKVRELEIDAEVASYLSTIFESVVPVNVPVGLNFSPQLGSKIKQSLEKTKSQTLADLAVNLSISTENLKCDPACCKRETMSKTVTLHGVCFVIDLCKSSFQSRQKSPIILLQLNNTDSFDTSFLLDGGVLALYSNRSEIGISTNDNIILPTDTITMIKLGISHLKRVNTAKIPCVENVGKSWPRDFQSDNPSLWSKSTTMCEFDCLDSTENRLCFNCSKYSLFQNNATLPQCEHWRHHYACSASTRQLVEQRLLECKRRCLPACQQTIYVTQSVTTLNFPKTHSCGADPKTDCMEAIIYYPFFTEWEYEDIQTINIDTFISSIGGQTGLWCGASVVSICQLISYFCCPCLHWADIKSSYYSNFRNPKKSNGGRRQSKSTNNQHQKHLQQNNQNSTGVGDRNFHFRSPTNSSPSSYVVCSHLENFSSPNSDVRRSAVSKV
uniref:Uncharacterized protein n=1 Tax=Romanomermis culicivorax TaxID=13658 RepID=A0A915IFI6_ROMCU